MLWLDMVGNYTQGRSRHCGNLRNRLWRLKEGFAELWLNAAVATSLLQRNGLDVISLRFWWNMAPVLRVCKLSEYWHRTMSLVNPPLHSFKIGVWWAGAQCRPVDTVFLTCIINSQLRARRLIVQQVTFRGRMAELCLLFRGRIISKVLYPPSIPDSLILFRGTYKNNPPSLEKLKNTWQVTAILPSTRQFRPSCSVVWLR
jgi:hypothetical protein